MEIQIIKIGFMVNQKPASLSIQVILVAVSQKKIIKDGTINLRL